MHFSLILLQCCCFYLRCPDTAAETLPSSVINPISAHNLIKLSQEEILTLKVGQFLHGCCILLMTHIWWCCAAFVADLSYVTSPPLSLSPLLPSHTSHIERTLFLTSRSNNFWLSLFSSQHSEIEPHVVCTLNMFSLLIQADTDDANKHDNAV